MHIAPLNILAYHLLDKGSTLMRADYIILITILNFTTNDSKCIVYVSDGHPSEPVIS